MADEPHQAAVPPITIDAGPADPYAIARAVRDELRKLQRRNTTISPASLLEPMPRPTPGDTKERRMFLTNDQAKRFQDHLRAADVRGDCPVCTRPIDWVQAAELQSTVFGWPGHIARTRRVVECTCPHCAVVVTFDAAALDL